MNNPIRQHHVPKFYLDGFVDSSGYVNVFDRVRKEYRSTAPKNLSVIKDYYTVNSKNGKSYEVETQLAKLEGHTAPIISSRLRKFNKSTTYPYKLV